jgi:hypothetical protein
VVLLTRQNQYSFSIDAGRTWTPTMAGWPGNDEIFLFFDPHYRNVLYRGDLSHGLWRSDDGGTSWIQLGVQLHEHSDLHLHPEVPNVLWVSDASGDILMSADRGATFAVAIDVPEGSLATGLDFDPSDSTLLFGTQDVSAFELPDSSPIDKIGSGTPGTGSLIPRHYASGLPRIGNTAFQYVGDQTVGGGVAVLFIGLVPGNLTFPGIGTLYMADPNQLAAYQTGGAPGAAGAGSFVQPLPLPPVPALAGIELLSQYLVVDPNAASGVAFSDALGTTLLP